MNASRREFVSGVVATTLFGASAATPGAVSPEQFGAKGDGRSNDTEAFVAMAAHVNRQGGAVIAMRPVTYIVGRESAFPAPGVRFAPVTIMHFLRCSEPVVIRGNGARLRCADGLRYGTFDPRTRHATDNPLPFKDPTQAAAPYRAMIRIEQCTGAIEISNLELDGNIERLQIGGKYGNAGWQLPAYGIQLVENSGPETLSKIHSHHHAHDGMAIDGPNERPASSTFSDITCDSNGRQGCSITGGRNYVFERCRFRNTGKVVLRSPPGAGVDIEAQGTKRIRQLRFYECEFSNNSGPGMVADSGDSEGALFENCIFVGTTGWAAWPKKPRFRFNRCMFVGPLVHAYGHADQNRAAQFHDCAFRDDPSLSPTGVVRGSSAKGQPIANLPYSENVLFSRCTFNLTHSARLPWSRKVVYSDCQMTQQSIAPSYPRGIYIGTNTIRGNAILRGSVIRGKVVLNGRLVPRTG